MGVVRRWVLACAAAEAIGMTAAASSARVSQALVGEPSGLAQVAVAVGVVTVGGLVEGVALGVAQARALAVDHPVPVRRYVLATVLLAGLGWAGVSAPAALAGGEGGGGAEPPQLLVVAGGAGLGLVMGALLGACQAWAMRGSVAHPRRWVTANAIAWVPAMGVIFWGATTAEADWQTWQVALLGAATGTVAGGLLGAVLGRWVPRLDRAGDGRTSVVPGPA